MLGFKEEVDGTRRVQGCPERGWLELHCPWDIVVPEGFPQGGGGECHSQGTASIESPHGPSVGSRGLEPSLSLPLTRH